MTAFRPGSGDQLSIQQCRNDSAGIYSTNFADFRYGDRLLVSDHRKCLQRGERQTDRWL